MVLDNKTFLNLAKSPLNDFRIFFYKKKSVSVIIESDAFVPFTNITRLLVDTDWEKTVPSLRSDLKILKISIQHHDMKLSTATLEFASKSKRSLQHFDLSYSLVSGIYGSAFRAFSCLRTLILNGVIYSMQYISDDAFYGLQNLQQLHLAHNQINKLPVQAFKAFVNGSLTFLDLGYNSLTGIFPDNASFSSFSSLTHLNLSGNPVQTVGKWIHALTNLQELKLDSLTTAMYFDVDDWTIPLWSMKQLYIKWPTFKDVLIGYTQFILFRHVPNIETLFLSGTYVKSVAVINNLHHLKYLDASESFSVFKNFENRGAQLSILLNFIP